MSTLEMRKRGGYGSVQQQQPKEDDDVEDQRAKGQCTASQDEPNATTATNINNVTRTSFEQEALETFLGLKLPKRLMVVPGSLWVYFVRFAYVLLVVYNLRVLLLQVLPLLPEVVVAIGLGLAKDVPISLDFLGYELAVSLQVWSSFFLMAVVLFEQHKRNNRVNKETEEKELKTIFGDYQIGRHFQKSAQRMWRFYIPCNFVLVAFIATFTLKSSVTKGEAVSTDGRPHHRLQFFFALIFSSMIQSTAFYFINSDMRHCEYLTRLLYKEAETKRLRRYLIFKVRNVVDEASAENSLLLGLVVIIALINALRMIIYFFLAVSASKDITTRQLLTLCKTGAFLGREFLLLGCTLYSVANINANSNRLIATLTESMWSHAVVKLEQREFEEELKVFDHTQRLLMDQAPLERSDCSCCSICYNCCCCYCCFGNGVGARKFEDQLDNKNDTRRAEFAKQTQALLVSEETKRERLLRLVTTRPIYFTIFGIKIDNAIIYSQIGVALSPLLFWAGREGVEFYRSLRS